MLTTFYRFNLCVRFHCVVIESQVYAVTFAAAAAVLVMLYTFSMAFSLFISDIIKKK